MPSLEWYKPGTILSHCSYFYLFEIAVPAYWALWAYQTEMMTNVSVYSSAFLHYQVTMYQKHNNWKFIHMTDISISCNSMKSMMRCILRNFFFLGVFDKPIRWLWFLNRNITSLWWVMSTFYLLLQFRPIYETINWHNTN